MKQHILQDQLKQKNVWSDHGGSMLKAQQFDIIIAANIREPHGQAVPKSTHRSR